MLLPFEQLCGSRLDYKIVHAFVRLTCVVSAVLLFILFYSAKVFALIRHTPLDDIASYWFFSSPIIVISIAVFDSFWFVRTQPETRALAIDWLFVVAYLIVWCFQMLKIFLSFPVF
jgi:hypothetical protein